MEAIRSICDKYIFWPEAEERVEIARQMSRKYQIPNVAGITNGTLLELTCMPEADGKADYSGRKKQWSLFTMIVNYDKATICHYRAGFSGTAHKTAFGKDLSSV